MAGSNLKVLRYTDQACEPYWEAFDTWLRSLRRDLDGDEDGTANPWSTRMWVYHNNFDLSSNYEGPWGTRLLIDIDSQPHTLLGTVTLSSDDRGRRKQFNIAGVGCWGGFIIDRTQRGKGYGTYLCGYIDKEIQDSVNSSGKPETWSIFAMETCAGVAIKNSPSIKVATHLGFQFNRTIEESSDTLAVYLKDYTRCPTANPNLLIQKK